MSPEQTDAIWTFVLGILMSVALIAGLASALFGWLVDRWDRFSTRRQTANSNEWVHHEVRHLNAEEPAEIDAALVLNADELAAVRAMIGHKTMAEKPTKESTLFAGFAAKKGASERYRRASALYDALFAPPPAPELPARTLLVNGERRVPL